MDPTRACLGIEQKQDAFAGWFRLVMNRAGLMQSPKWGFLKHASNGKDTNNINSNQKDVRVQMVRQVPELKKMLKDLGVF